LRPGVTSISFLSAKARGWCRSKAISGWVVAFLTGLEKALAEGSEALGVSASQYSTLSFVDWLMVATIGLLRNSVRRQMLQIAPGQ
jgi:hypothetical protein